MTPFGTVAAGGFATVVVTVRTGEADAAVIAEPYNIIQLHGEDLQYPGRTRSRSSTY